MIYSFFESNFSFEKGIFRTIKELSYKPGEVVNNYIKGITNPYYTPLKFVFVAASFSALLMISTGVFEDTSANQAAISERSVKQKEATMKMMQFIGNYMSLISLVYLPFAALMSKLFFKKPKYNFAEHLVFNAYTQGQATLYGMILTLAVWLGLDFLSSNSAFTIAGVLINLIVYIQFSISTFKYSWYNSMWRGALVYLVSYLLYLILLTVVMVFLVMKQIL
jgi:hypothetical protein